MAADRIVTLGVDPDASPHGSTAGAGWWSGDATRRAPAAPGAPAQADPAAASTAAGTAAPPAPSAASRVEAARGRRRVVEAASAAPPRSAGRGPAKGWF